MATGRTASDKDFPYWLVARRNDRRHHRGGHRHERSLSRSPQHRLERCLDHHLRDPGGLCAGFGAGAADRGDGSVAVAGASADRPVLCRDHPRRADPGAALLHRLRRRAGFRACLEFPDIAVAGGGPSVGAQGARYLPDVAGDHLADDRLFGLHRGGFPRRDPGGGRGPDRGGAGAGSEPLAAFPADHHGRRRCAPYCRRSATISSPWSRIPRSSPCSASPT